VIHCPATPSLAPISTSVAVEVQWQINTAVAVAVTVTTLRKTQSFLSKNFMKIHVQVFKIIIHTDGHTDYQAETNTYSSLQSHEWLTLHHIHCVSKVSSPFLFFLLLSQMLTDFNNIWYFCSSWVNLQSNDVFLSSLCMKKYYAVRGQTLLLRLAIVPVFLAAFPKVCSVHSPQSPTFIQKFLNKLLCSITFKNVQIFHQICRWKPCLHKASSATK